MQRVPGNLNQVKTIERTPSEKFKGVSRRKRGHRQEFTLLRITEILTDGNKPSKTAQPRAQRASAAAVEEGAVHAGEAAAAPEASATSRAKPKSAGAKGRKPQSKGKKK